MDEATRSGAGGQDPDEGREQALGLTSEVRSLREELGELRRTLAAEVRTRRIVVVEEDGFERCTLQASGNQATVTVAGRPGPAGLTTAVEMFVHDPIDGDGTSLGFELIDGGNVVGSFSLVSPERPTLWIDGDSGS